MLRYDRQTKPGLVALYDIRPGNGAGPFLEPRNPHGAHPSMSLTTKCSRFAPWAESRQASRQPSGANTPIKYWVWPVNHAYAVIVFLSLFYSHVHIWPNSVWMWPTASNPYSWQP